MTLKDWERAWFVDLTTQAMQAAAQREQEQAAHNAAAALALEGGPAVKVEGVPLLSPQVRAALRKMRPGTSYGRLPKRKGGK